MLRIFLQNTISTVRTSQVAQRRRTRLPTQERLEPLAGPSPAFQPGESRGQRSLAGCRPWAAESGHNLRD